MSKLQEIMNEVAKEQYDCSWVYACTFMHAGDVENLMKKVARRYATEVARHNLEKQHECIRNLIRIYHNTDGDELKASITDIVDTWMKARDLITSLEIELI